MFGMYIILAVFAVCLLPLPAKSVQIRLTNSNKDKMHTSDNNGAADSYSYQYDISDDGTGDNKAKWEKRENNIVRGAYSVVEPDGSTRLVEYTADANGFHPVITKLDASNPVSSLSPSYDITPSNVYNPSSLDNGSGYNQRPGANLNYNIGSNDRGNVYQTNSYRTPVLNDGYHNGYNSKATFTGYVPNRGYRDSNVPGASYYLSQRQGIPPAPLLHSAYHGYDNLYH